jgi:hypothetical protein
MVLLVRRYFCHKIKQLREHVPKFLDGGFGSKSHGAIIDGFLQDALIVP